MMISIFLTSQPLIIRLNALRLDFVYQEAISIYVSISNQLGVDAVNKVRVDAWVVKLFNCSILLEQLNSLTSIGGIKCTLR